jgi:hypothetical protein
MRKSVFRIAAFAASAMLALAAGAQAQDEVSIEIGSATGNQGATVQVSVTMTTPLLGTEVAGTQNDITFAGELGGGIIQIAAKANGKPSCTVNPDIDKGATSFAFQPSGCTPGTNCTGIRALVLALDNVAAIPSGSVLYTCDVLIAADAPPDDYSLNNSNEGASTPDGTALTTSGTDGTVTVEGVVVTPAVIHVGSTSGNPGQPDLSIDVTLETLLGTEVAGTQNDITFSGGVGAAIRIKAKANGKPDCAVNPDIDKGGTSFAFQPSGCSGEECTGVRSLVLALDNVAAIPNGSVLYTCGIDITETAEVGQTYDLVCSNAGASDGAGVAIDTSCTNGTVEVGGVIVPTSTPTDTPVVDTPTPAATSTNTTVPTLTKKPTNTPGGGGNDDDGCAIVAPAQSSFAWMLLLPAAALLWFRRRSR